MWRAFFFAVGAMAIIVGIECIVVGRFTISQEARLPQFVANLLDERGQANQNFADNANQAYGQLANGQPAVEGYGGAPGLASRFGQSRFGGSQYGNDQFFSGGNGFSNQAAGGNSPFALTGYGSNPNELASAANGGWKTPKSPKIIATQDWMPWSLIAAGTIIMLYTNSLSGRREHGGE